jgi:hypothetical protein
MVWGLPSRLQGFLDMRHDGIEERLHLAPNSSRYVAGCDESWGAR